MFLTFTEKSVSVFINVTMTVSGPAAFYILIKSFLKLSLIFAAFISDVVSFDVSVISFCKFSFLFLL